MRIHLAAALLAATASIAVAEPTPKDQLLVPPANAEHFVVVSEAGKHGDEWRWVQPDGSIAYRESILLRGLVFEQDEVVKVDSAGKPVSIVIRGVTPSGDSAETFAIDQAMASWKTPVDEGHAAAGQALYYPFGGTFLANDALVSSFLQAGKDGIALLPSGRGRLEPSRTLEVTSAAGAKKTIRLYFLTGVNVTPNPVWLDDKGKLFAINGGLALLPAGYEGSLQAITTAQNDAIAALAPDTAKRFLTAEARQPVLFDHVKIFDADKGAFVPDQAVLVQNGKIAAIGAGGSITPPPTVRVIDGKGKSLVPGLWDSHMHLSDDFGAISELALGITSCRNPGSSIDIAVSQRKRRAEGTLLAPECFTSAIIDKKGPLAAQGSLTVASLDETLAAVRKIKAAGLTGVKFYTSMDPAWIAPAAKLAHELGLHVHGHIPAGMRTLDAINAGYDEITHIYFATMQAMPQDVVDKANTTVRMTGPGRYFKDVDLNGAVIRDTIAGMKAHHTVIDPTLVVVEGVLLAEAGKLSPAYTAYSGTLPPATERGFRGGGLPLPDGMTLADARASVKKMGQYVAQMRDAGVPIVAGTDGQGMELVRELELYVDGGMTTAEALQTATIVPARNVGVDGRTGSIAVGKEADLVLVDGDPEARIGDLRRVEKVVSDGFVMDGDALRREAGYSGEPK